jgi:hypothetical protein
MNARGVVVVALVWSMVAVGIGIGAGPAWAAMDSNCSLSVSTPTSNGVYVYSTTTVTCSTYMDHTAVEARNRIAEQVAGAWVYRTDWNTVYSAGTTSLSVTQSYYCNGHGTDNYRGQGYGKTSDGGSTTATGSSRSWTC